MNANSAVVRLALRYVYRAMRSRPSDFRACLPFDASDRDDMESWVRDRLTQRAWSGNETPHYVIKWILWQAGRACRRKFVPTVRLFDQHVDRCCRQRSGSAKDIRERRIAPEEERSMEDEA